MRAKESHPDGAGQLGGFGGAGGSRTRVQMSDTFAFYMLSRNLVFDCRLASNHPPTTYLLVFAIAPKRSCGYPLIDCAPYADWKKAEPPARRLVSQSNCEMKPIIYCRLGSESIVIVAN